MGSNLFKDLCPVAKSTIMSTDSRMSMEKSGGKGQDWPMPSNTEDRKIKSPRLHTHNCILGPAYTFLLLFVLEMG